VRCPNCGTENVAEARFCVSCGRELSDAAARGQAGAPTGSVEAGAPTGPIEPAAPAAPVVPAAPTEQIGVVAAEPTLIGAPMEPPPPPRSTFSAGWSTALARGALAFAVMLALGQAIAFGAYAAAGRSIVVATVARIGGVYFELFHRVGIEFRASNLSGSSIAGAGGAVGGLSLTISVGLLLATLLAIVLLFRAGRAVADRAGGPMLSRVVHGMKPSIVYGVLAFAFSFLIQFHIAVPSNPVFSGEINVEPSHLAAFLYPFLIALVAGAAGGLRSAALAGEASEPWGRRTLGVWGGGVRMLALGLVLSFVGLLVLAALDPTTTADYFRGAFNGGAARGTVLVGHHVLLSPNQSMWVLVPSMGGSLNLSIAGSNVELLSYSHFPEHLSLTGGPTSGFGTPIPSVQGGTAPAGYFLFLLVPLLSVLIGGRSGAARGSVRARPEAAMVGALAGVVFAVLVALVALISTIGLAVSVDVAGFHTGGSGYVGPNALVGGLLALVWGAAGGALGGLFYGRSLPAVAPAADVPAGSGFEAGTVAMPPPPAPPAGSPSP
jgi:hypothetical protein